MKNILILISEIIFQVAKWNNFCSDEIESNKRNNLKKIIIIILGSRQITSHSQLCHRFTNLNNNASHSVVPFFKLDVMLVNHLWSTLKFFSSEQH